MHVIHVYSEERRADRNCMPTFASVRTCALARGRNWLGTSGEGWTGEGEEATHKHPHAQAYIHPPRERVERRTKGGGEGRHGGGIYYSGFTVITRRERTTPQRRYIRRGVCLSDTCSSRTHTHTHTYLYAHGRIVATSRHPCIPSPSDLRFVVLPLHACITSRVIER